MKYGIWVSDELWYEETIDADLKFILLDIAVHQYSDAPQKQLQILRYFGYIDENNQLTEKSKKVIEVK